MLLVLLGGGVGVLACLGVSILAAVALPKVTGAQARSRQSECIANLSSFQVAARLALQERDYLRLDLAMLGFRPERGNRYAYFVGPGPLEDRGGLQVPDTRETQGIGVDSFRFPEARRLTFHDLPKEVAAEVGMSGTCPDCAITMACAGDIDDNPSDPPDVWSVSTRARRTPGGEPIPAGKPFHHVDDLASD
jgi:type II secretory pathway pseudopilin PulG